MIEILGQIDQTFFILSPIFETNCLNLDKFTKLGRIGLGQIGFVLLITQLLREWEDWARKPVNHTNRMDVVCCHLIDSP